MTAAILDARRPVVPDMVLPNGAADLVRMFPLDRPLPRRQLVCQWHCGADGRLACIWAPDIAFVPEN